MQVCATSPEQAGRIVAAALAASVCATVVNESGDSPAFVVDFDETVFSADELAAVVNA